MKRYLILAVGVMVFLTACQVTVTVGTPFDDAERVTARERNNTDSVGQGTLSAGEEDYYRVNVPAGRQGELVFFELKQRNIPATITVFDSNRREILASNNRRFFASGTGSLSTAGELDAQSISVTGYICEGPCGIVRKRSQDTTYFVRVRASSTARTFDYDLAAYTADTQDPMWDESGCKDVSVESAVGPTSIGVVPADPIVERGAIEILGDEDCFDSGAFGIREITFETSTGNEGIRFRVVIEDEDGREIRSFAVGPGPASRPETLKDRQPVRIRVFSDNNRAGPAGSSTYQLTLD